MDDSYLSSNYRLRKHFLSTNEVPTQTLIKKKMSAPLAAVYFKTMTPKLKEMVGLEPPMKGGGGDWYVPPKDLLEGRTVLKPLKKECLSKLNYLGIDTIGIKMLEKSVKRMQIKRDKIISESDEKWKAEIEVACKQFMEVASEEAAEKNTEKIQTAFTEFTNLYQFSIGAMENVLFDAARKEIINIQNQTFESMQYKYNTFMKTQAVKLYDIYENKIITDKSRLKSECIENITSNRNKINEMIHDLNLEKHAAIEKLRKYLECQSLACQIYVALKEREECIKDIDRSKHLHKKKVKTMSDEIAAKDYEISSQVQKKEKQQAFDAIWQNKVWHIVKNFQIFVSYCLSLLPEHAEFFINIEKLMLLQFNEALENPSAESIIEVEEEYYEGPRPQPRPFYLFCDKGHKYETQIEKDLCPKRCSSSASQMPVIVVNKRCMYAACDNFQQFTNKAKHFIYGKRGDDADFVDYTVYEHYVPVKYTSSQQLLELKLESSLLQILQQELTNVRKIPIECTLCKRPYCFCTCTEDARTSISTQHKTILQQPVSDTIPADNKLTRSAELDHKREPKWESFLKYVEPKKCGCPKTSKKHLLEHLPIYMRSMSVYDTPELLNYEICPPHTLKNMVRKARGNLPDSSPIVAQKTRDVATQCIDLEFDAICNCFSEDELQRLIQKQIITGSKLYHATKRDERFDYAAVPSVNGHDSSSSKVSSLSTVADDLPVLQELFKSTGRTFD